MAICEEIGGRIQMALHAHLSHERSRRVAAFLRVCEVEVITVGISISALSHEERVAGGGYPCGSRIIRRRARGVGWEQEIIDRVTVEPGLVWVALATPEIGAAAIGLQGADPGLTSVGGARKRILVVVGIEHTGDADL